MDLSKEAYQLIVKYTRHTPADLCALAMVSRSFHRAAEPALYHTIHIRDPRQTIALCDRLASHARLAALVRALTVHAAYSDHPGHGGDGDGDDDAEPLPDNYWHALARALEHTVRLRSLNLHADADAAHAWILRRCHFTLRAFHCDLVWDRDLVSFLNGQHDLRDLYIVDFKFLDPPPGASASPSSSSSPPPPPPLALDPRALPALSTLECSFPEAAHALVPGRPVRKLKTCFSREHVPDKQRELAQLLASLRRATAHVRALDLADASYTEDFSLFVLAEVSRRLPELRYLGTLVLPVGKERLQFFGMLMRLRKLHTIEVEVSDWDPPPPPQALRALASEMRLYCTSIACVVFVQQDFARTVVRAVNGICVIQRGADADAERLWRDV